MNAVRPLLSAEPIPTYQMSGITGISTVIPAPVFETVNFDHGGTSGSNLLHISLHNLFIGQRIQVSLRSVAP